MPGVEVVDSQEEEAVEGVEVVEGAVVQTSPEMLLDSFYQAELSSNKDHIN